LYQSWACCYICAFPTILFRKFGKGKLQSLSYSPEVCCSVRQQVTVTLPYLSTKLCGVTSQRSVNLVCHLHSKLRLHLLIVTSSNGLLVLLTGSLSGVAAGLLVLQFIPAFSSRERLLSTQQ
jgi:hypothetical protein